MSRQEKKTAVVTGASSGIGAATARACRRAGFRLYLGSRRLERLMAVAEPLQATALRLDVTDGQSVEAFVNACPDRIDLLVNNAGAALGLDRIENARDDQWRRMWETNVLGVVRMIRALLPRLRQSPTAHLVNIGSIAGFETYVGGAGYTASKHALRAVTRTLRLELLGEPVRVTEIAPGLVDTEFSIVRFAGNEEKAARVYRDMTPLTGDDVAECVVWAATRPPHVNIDEIIIRPRDQASATQIHRAHNTSSKP